MNDRERVLTERLADIHKEFRQAIQPLVEAKAEFYRFILPTMVMHPDGTVEHKYNFTEEQLETMRIADEAMDYMRESYQIEADDVRKKYGCR